jgi:rod shape determining protein RodA
MTSYIKEYFDYKTFCIICALVLIGFLSVYSATFSVNNALNFYRQIIWGSIGLIIMLVAGFIPLRTVQRLSVPFYFLILFVLLIVLVIGITVKGSKRWIGVGGFGGQPSEFAKIATVLAFASYLSKTDVSLVHLKHLILALLIFAAPMIIILIQPDLGTSIVFFSTLVLLLYWTGVSRFILLSILVPIMVAGSALFGTTIFLIAIVLGAALLYLCRENRFAFAVIFGITLAVGLSVQIVVDRMPLYQQKRISTYLNPEADLLGAGYNVVQSKIAIGSGGFLGKGYLKGTQTQFNYIPEHRTDFIFCVVGEEFGFVGSAFILLLFAALCLHGIRIATLSKNRFGSLAALGLTAILATHAIVNIGMCMGSVPVIGIPLPFLSYGGSALVSNMMLSGLLMNFYTNRKEY